MASYYCHSTGGSSGSAMIAESSNNAIILNNSGPRGDGCGRAGGIRIESIWPRVKSFFNNIVPSAVAPNLSGSGNTNTKPEPTCNV